MDKTQKQTHGSRSNSKAMDVSEKNKDVKNSKSLERARYDEELGEENVELVDSEWEDFERALRYCSKFFFIFLFHSTISLKQKEYAIIKLISIFK